MAVGDRHREFERAWADPLTRRDLLRAAGVSVGALAVGTSLASCTSATPEQEGSASKPGPPHDFSGALAHQFLALDPIVQTAFGTVVVTDFIHEVLYRLDPFPPRTDVTPELATKLPTELDSTTYRVPLREGVTFHDGSAFTADDVVFTIGRIKEPDNSSLFIRFFEILESVEAVGEHELEFRLTTPTTLLAELLSLAKIQSRSAVEASPDALELDPVGTGPYRIASAVSGERVTLKRFEGYTGPRTFTYDEVTLGIVADANARSTGLRSNQWKAIEEVQTSALDNLSVTGGLDAAGVPAYHQVDLLFHCGKPPFDDPRVRQAALYAIDRDAITEASFFGQAEPAWAGHLSPDHPSFVQPERVYRYDPAQARQLLESVGYGDEPIDIDFLVATNIEVINSQAPLVEQSLIDIGFRPNVISGEQEALYSRVAEGTFNVYLASRDASALGVTDAVLLLRLVFTGAFPRTLLYWDGEPLVRFEELSDRAVAAPDVATRDALLVEMVNMLQEEVPLAPLHFKNQLTAWSAELEGFRPLPTVGLALEGVSG